MAPLGVLSSNMLNLGLNYARCFGTVNFSVQRNLHKDNGYVAQISQFYKWFCIVSRLLCIVVYIYTIWSFRDTNDSVMNVLAVMRAVFCSICGIAVMALQICWSKRVIVMVNRFLSLFRHLRRLMPTTNDDNHQGFGCRREFVLLLLKVGCWAYECSCHVPMLLRSLDKPMHAAYIVCDIYVTISALLLLHLCFVGYLSVGALYSQINAYVQRDLRRQLRSLNANGDGDGDVYGSISGDKVGEDCCQRRLKAIMRRMNECIGIYDEIRCLGQEFHRLLELPLCLTVCFSFSSIATAIYFIIVHTQYHDVARWFLVLKMFTDVVLLTLAAHGAVTSSRVVRRLGLDTANVGADKRWHRNLDMFLSRLNLYEFRVQPLGLFEISNELILFFMSGLVTYLTYIAQSAMQSSLHK